MDRVVADRKPLKITRHRAEAVVMIAESEWASIEETLYLLDSPANARELMDAIHGLDAGKGVEYGLVDT